MSGNYCIRALDPAERFIWLLDHVSCANFVVMAELAGHPLSEDILRRGLDKLQASHPLLSARVHEGADGTIAFFREEGARIPLRVEEWPDENWQQPIEAEFNAKFDDPGLPLMRCRLLKLRSRSVLSLTFHHVIADGRSAFPRLRELLRFCLRGAKITALSDIPPPMHSLFPPRLEWKAHPGTAQELAQAMQEDFLRHGPPAELPFLAHKEPRRAPALRQIRLDPARGRRLKERCKEEGASIHGAVCAAHLVATHGLFASPDAETLYLMCPVDMRPHLASDIGDQLSYCTTFLRSNYRVDGPAAFWPLARHIGEDFKRRLSRGDGHLMYALLPLDQIGSTGPAFAAFVAGMAQLPTGSNISNVGRIEPLDDCPEVLSISGALCSLPKHLASLNVTSYKDELIINMTYDAAKLTLELPDHLAGRLQHLLGEAASVREASATP